ncbi:MAG TPA: rhodanese-like domain-containing protein, partial [Pseudogracilibacillus sp.]|nr:rhodanese-like domain-containing protein [Pseudogracilibacillus sp.]
VINEENTFLIDVRNDAEWNAGHFEQANHLFLGHLRHTTIPENKKLVIHCQSGARARIASSILMKRGFTDVHRLQANFQDVFTAVEK